MSTVLPEVVLRQGVGWTNITVKGKGFAWVNHAAFPLDSCHQVRASGGNPCR